MKIVKQHGFTMVEMLITVAIILVLSGMGLAAYSGQLQRSRDEKRRAHLEVYREALERYRADHFGYPVAYGVDISDPTRVAGVSVVLPALDPYLEVRPQDPLAPDRYYNYLVFGTREYRICTLLEELPPAGAGPQECTPTNSVCNFCTESPTF
ncbi:type II secretion system protein [Candidatus Roizmanbacteria bacterium]|nr:type II secretion system protein [Candidatus Roizmanbacteria bacterium]